MSRDDRAEYAAIPLVLALLAAGALLLLAVSSEEWAWLLVAVPVLGLGVVAALAMRSRRLPPPPDLAGRAEERGDGVHRILVVADEGVPAVAFRDAVALSAQAGATEVFVTAPALASRLGRWTGDEASYDTARQHLDDTLRALSALGVEASGKIGASDPIQAADDALRVFAANELVIATHPDSEANWLEQDVVDVARSRYGLPVTHIVGHGDD